MSRFIRLAFKFCFIAYVGIIVGESYEFMWAFLAQLLAGCYGFICYFEGASWFASQN
jgi:hypothetical protein